MPFSDQDDHVVTLGVLAGVSSRYQVGAKRRGGDEEEEMEVSGIGRLLLLGGNGDSLSRKKAKVGGVTVTKGSDAKAVAVV
jgi:hypothetical protein